MAKTLSKSVSLTGIQKRFFGVLAETLDLGSALKEFPGLDSETVQEWFRRLSGKREASSRFKAYVDGASRGNPGKAGAGVWIEGDPPNELTCYLGEATNNEAEYQALLVALKEAHRRGVAGVQIYSDSELLVRQVQGGYQIRSEKLRPLYEQVKDLIERFAEFEIQHVPREKNREADRLANKAIDQAREA